MIDDPRAKSETDVAYETVRGAVAGDDVPMESEHKVATAALVGATYPIILMMMLIVGLVVAYFTAWRTSDARKNSTNASVPEAIK
jgi:hypothetical protein